MQFDTFRAREKYVSLYLRLASRIGLRLFFVGVGWEEEDSCLATFVGVHARSYG